LQDEQEKVETDAQGSVVQIAKYLHGVGDSRNAIQKILGGVFGAGFIERIVRGYTFVSRNYRDGDRIYLVGFSRGAYTVRALGAMIVQMGLLPAEALCPSGSYDPELAYRLGIAVWSSYRKKAGKRSTLLGFLDEFHARPVDISAQVTGVTIEAIGVWDTVGALGIPVVDPKERERVDVFEFADTELSPRVAAGLHAVSIDEMRGDFRPTLWTPRPGVTQVWFAGAHADVGGGYPQDLLSNHALDWMVRNMRRLGIRFPADLTIRISPSHAPINTPWEQPPFKFLLRCPRKHPETALFHRSVERRLREFGSYEPVSLANILDGRSLPRDRVVD
jgi:glutathione S-transferase